MNTRKIFLVLVAMGMMLTGCKHGSKEAKSTSPKGPAGEVVVNILSVNDMHSNIDLFPKFAAMVDSLKAIYPDLLVFSAGDNRTGNPINDMYTPVNYPVITLMNEVGFNVSTVGNHEWDGDVDNFHNDIERADFPFLCANVFIPDTVDLDIKPYIIIENQGIKLAVVGLIEVRHDGIPGAHPDKLKAVSFKNARVVLPEYKYLKNESNAMILLSHCGFEDDMELAQANPWLDVIIGGHSHTLIEHPSETNGVLITQSGSHLKYATLVTLKFKDGKLVEKYGKVLNVKSVRKEKPEIRKMVDEFNDAPALNEAIATALTRFENPEEIGCMMTDAIREVSGADFAFQNTGGVRVNHLKQGPITVKDVYSIDPFNNEIIMFQMTGAQVKHFILNSYRKNGGHPSYVSGMSYTMGDDGKSVWIEADGGNFSTKKTYKVAFNSYMASTVDVQSEDEGRSLFMTSEEMIIEFLKAHKTVDYQGVSRIR